MRNEKLTKYVFVLGREQELALFELKSVLLRLSYLSIDMLEDPSIFRISGNLAFANMDKSDKKIASLIDSLAGTIKIFKFVSKDVNDSERVISEHIKNIESSKFNFGISSFSPMFSQDRVNKVGFAVRKRLKGLRSSRFVELRDGKELSSVLTKKNGLIGKGAEFGLFPFGIGLLIALNDPEEWSKRDYGKPREDKFSGMVPPKLARMMINLALGQLVKSQKSKVESTNENCKLLNDKCLILDPFCGSGNILAEALLLGCDVIGSDNSTKAINDTTENLKWLYQNYQIKGDHKVFQADATESELIENLKFKISNLNENCELVNENCIAVVAEPYLGEPKKYKPTFNAAKGEYSKIKELYLGFLKNIKENSNFATLQLRNFVICIIFPIVETSDKGQFSLYRESVDEIRKLGYTHIRNNFVYGRDYQVVKREIVLLKLI